MKFRTLLMSAPVALAIVACAGTAKAATILNGWNLNLSAANGLNGFSGLSDATNIDQIIVNGNATITQTVVGGVALGQPFSESGVLQLISFEEEPGGGAVESFDLGNARALYLAFTGLTGVLNPDSTITFDQGSGSIRLVLDSDADLNPLTGTTLTLATYEIIDPSGGSNLDFFGGTAANATVDVTLQQLTGLPLLYTGAGGGDLESPLVFHLVNVDSLLDPRFPNNPDNSGVIGGNGSSIIHVRNSGQYNIAAVPEPATLGLFGVGLLLLGLTARRGSKRG